MQSNHSTGNRVVLLLSAFVMVLCSLFVEWGTATMTQDELAGEVRHQAQVKGGMRAGAKGMDKFAIELRGALLKGVQLPVSAASSAIYLGPVRFPYWAGCVCSGSALVVLILNTIGFSNTPRIILFALFACGTFAAMWALVNMLANGSAGAGAVLLLLGSIIGTCSAVQPPRTHSTPSS